MKQRIELGYVAIYPNGDAYTGCLYQAGAKVYKSEKMARASVRNHRDAKGQPIKYDFVPAFIEIEVPNAANQS
jgi:hypothetical protein